MRAVMRISLFFALLAAIVIAPNPAFSQAKISDLQAELQSGSTIVEDMRGNGSSN